jgi:hypothetical protein
VLDLFSWLSRRITRRAYLELYIPGPGGAKRS